MSEKIAVRLSGVLAALVALTAIGGGFAMLAGVDDFPREWLRETPFEDYTIPALILAGVVGGSSLVAAYAIFTRHPRQKFLLFSAGLLLTGYIVVEVLILKQDPPGPTPIEIFYLGIGVLMVGISRVISAASPHKPPV